MNTQNRIQTRFGGDSLPTSIHQHDEVITNLGNLVAMQEHMGDAIMGRHHSVIELPILAIGDSIVHQAFDLSHCLNCVDLGSMGQIGAKVNPPNHHLCLWVRLGGLMGVFHNPVENY